MTKIQIIGTRAEIDKTIRALHRAGVVQIEERLASLDPLGMDESAAHQRDETAQLLARLDALVALMPKRSLPKNADALYDAQASHTTSEILAEVRGALGKFDVPAQNLARRREALEADRV